MDFAAGSIGVPRGWTRSGVHLLLAGVVLAHSNGIRAIPIAAWLAPALLLRFLRTHRTPAGALLGYLVLAAAAAAQLVGALGPMHGPRVILGITLLAVLGYLPYLVDRAIAHRLKGFPSTLVLPLAWVTTDLVFSFAVADIGFVGTTQVGQVALLQLASVTGIFGITFIVVWFASVVNWTLEQGLGAPRARHGLLAYAAVLGAVGVAGYLRERSLRGSEERVRVAGITLDADAATRATGLLHRPDDAREAEVRREAGEATRGLFGRLLAKSAEEARAGAEIVLWAEASGLVLQEDLDASLDEARQVARDNHIYIVAAVVVIPRGDEPARNEIIIFDDHGAVAARHAKSFLSPGERAVPGDGSLPLIASPYGRLSAAICAEFSRHRLIAQSGRGAADVLFDSASEWEPLSTSVAITRAVENGVTLVKQTRGAPSVVADAAGHVLAWVGPRAGDDVTMRASIPVRGVRTVYAAVGDLFAYVCVGALAVLVLKTRPWRSRRPHARNAALAS